MRWPRKILFRQKEASFGAAAKETNGQEAFKFAGAGFDKRQPVPKMMGGGQPRNLGASYSPIYGGFVDGDTTRLVDGGGNYGQSNPGGEFNQQPRFSKMILHHKSGQ